MSNTAPLITSFDVRFCETDALQHVSNTALVAWFEAAREPIFRIFTPELDLKNWPLILASYKVDFLAQIFYGKPVNVFQELWQDDKLCSTGITTMVHFDYKTQRSAPIPDRVKSELQSHFKEVPTQ